METFSVWAEAAGWLAMIGTAVVAWIAFLLERRREQKIFCFWAAVLLTIVVVIAVVLEAQKAMSFVQDQAYLAGAEQADRDLHGFNLKAENK